MTSVKSREKHSQASIMCFITYWSYHFLQCRCLYTYKCFYCHFGSIC